MTTPYYHDAKAGITIYHGRAEEILPGLGKFDALITDPPYGNGFAGQPTKWQRLAGQTAEGWDEDTISFIEQVRAAGRVQIIWGGNHYPLPPSRGWLVWFKPDAPPSMGDCELAWTNMDANARHIEVSISSTNAERLGHPTQKPLRVMTFSILCAGPGIETIIDPFCGVGTTLRAAKDLGRRAVGIELDERHAEKAARRLCQEVLNLA